MKKTTVTICAAFLMLGAFAVSMKDALQPYVDSGELPGAISVLYDNGRQEVACVGYADVAAKRSIGMDDAFMQCSQTKGFCGVTVAKLVEEGRLNLDDPVSKYLPEFKTLWVLESESNGVRTLRRAQNTLTVRMVMNHTGGFPFELPAKQGNIPGGGWSGGMPIRSVAAEAAALPILFEPGTKAKYSNTGIDIGAAVVESVTGKKWEMYLKETVLDPLGMKDTWFWPTDEQLAHQVELYDCHNGAPATYRCQDGMEQRPYNDSHVFASAGAGLWTTANDQLKFYKMLMNLGLGDNGVRILKEDTVKSLLAVTTRPLEMGGYSLGLNTPKIDGENEWFGHGGAWGTNCMINWHKKQLKLWVVQLTGKPRPWDKARDCAADDFFKVKIDNSGAEAYTGRIGETTFASPSAPNAEPPPIRLAYNYCTPSYTFAYYSDAEWDAEIDRLAKAGYNVALVTDGTFKVWQMTLRDLGFDEEVIKAFIPDECARSWWLMDNLAGEGGPLDQKTIEEDGARGRRICAKMREKGIEPILQGFFGMMPDAEAGLPGYRLIPQGKWQCYERPPILDPTCPAFAKAAEVWYRNLEAVYGIKPRYLAGDLFHEGGNSHGVDVTAAARAVQGAQQSAFPGVTWVVQAWGRNPTPALRAGLDVNHTLIEALVPQMNSFMADDSVCTLEFGEFPWVWCSVLNFGGKHGLFGNLKTFARLGRAAKGKGAKTFRGYGSLSEGYFTNPVCYDLFEEMMMRPVGSEMTDAELAAWLDAWVDKRYGLAESNASTATAYAQLHEAWRILAGTVYATTREHGGPFENLMCANPAWDVQRASTWGPKTGPWYETAELEKALELMTAAQAFCPSANLARDIYDVARQVKADRFRVLLPQMKNGDRAAWKECEEIFSSICEAPIASVPPEFRLATYEARARARAGERGVKAWRRMITTWSDDAKFGRSRLADYAQREYAELMADYYIPRWREFFKNADNRKATSDEDYDMGDVEKN